jgi:hypothetical protein
VGPQGPQGVQGDVGPQGPQGVAGPSGATGEIANPLSSIFTITNTTAVTSTNTGALQVAGGVGISGGAFVGGDLTVNGLTTLAETTEVLNVLTNATGVVTHNFTTAGVFYHTSITNNFVANFTNVPTTNNRSIGIALILEQGATPYMCTGTQIDGVSQPIKWEGGSVPIGNTSTTEIVSFSLIRSGSAWTVLGNQSTYN